MATADKVLKEALSLKPAEKAELIDKLLSSLDKPDAELEAVWAKEVESRVDAYEHGEIKAVTLERVLESNQSSGRRSAAAELGHEPLRGMTSEFLC